MAKFEIGAFYTVSKLLLSGNQHGTKLVSQNIQILLATRFIEDSGENGILETELKSERNLPVLINFIDSVHRLRQGILGKNDLEKILNKAYGNLYELKENVSEMRLNHDIGMLTKQRVFNDKYIDHLCHYIENN